MHEELLSWIFSTYHRIEVTVLWIDSGIRTLLFWVTPRKQLCSGRNRECSAASCILIYVQIATHSSFGDYIVNYPREDGFAEVTFGRPIQAFTAICGWIHTSYLNYWRHDLRVSSGKSIRKKWKPLRRSNIARLHSKTWSLDLVVLKEIAFRPTGPTVCVWSCPL